ncbi:uncharacterized protein LOC110991064 isoform X2 [Acanthaster planci]|uniref:Uncharacterized protein LOC110991064 isoform X2 n=1 Tax=Acanthaster planci TaxID=133434 RepID=A0A8B8A3B9_ACAPL|nr:uncharacterized protein LOC110991064 isoform X2 [Acanthaster planci]
MGFSIPALACSLAFLVALYQVSAFHFRGGILTWKSLPIEPKSIQVNYWVAWKKNYSEPRFDVCTPNSVAAQQPLRIGKSLNCGDQTCIDDMTYICTDYNEAGDYAAGQGSQIIAAPDGADVFDISFHSCCWVNLENYPVPRHYLLNATVNLTPRGNRGGLINSSPVAAVVPVQLVQQSCSHVIRIPVSDPDGDVVRCRFPVESNRECFKVCGPLANADLQNSGDECVLIYDGSSQSTGWYAVTIMIEDFNRRRSRRPLSRVPLHFLINVTATDDNCHQPRFQHPTPENGACLPAAVGQQKIIKLAASSEDAGISGISTFGLPLGMTVSPLTSHPGNPALFYVELSWVPQDNQAGPHQICFAAFDRKNNKEFASDQVCVTVFVGAPVVHPVPEVSRPQPGQTVDVSNQEWEIHFNSTIMQHTTEAGAIVSFIRNDTDETVYTVNLAAESNLNVQFPTEDSVVFNTPGIILEGDTVYVLRVHEGAVRSDTECKSNSAAHEWHFVTGPDHNLPATRFSPEEIRRVSTAVPECFSSFMLIYVSKAWLATVSSLVDPAGMHLNDPSCTGEEFNETHYILGATHDMCGTAVESESSNVQVVENIVHIPPQPESPSSPITRDNNIEVHVTCRLTGAKVTHAQFDPNITTIVYYETGYGTFNFQLRMFHDSSFGNKYRPRDYPIDVYQKQRLYFEAKVMSNDDMSIFLQSCRATPTANPRDPTSYVFIDSGCKVDDTVQFHELSNSMLKRFSIEAFAFIGNNLHGSVFVHCDIATCFADDIDSPCARGCVESPSIARRDTSQTGSASKAYPNTDGPIRIHTTTKQMGSKVMTASKQFNFSLVELPMLTAAILLLSIILLVLIRVVKITGRPKRLETPMNPHRVDRIKLPSIRIGNE